jgi:hypothetical protein
MSGSEMLSQVAQVNADAKAGRLEVDEELPEGNAPLEARAPSEEVAEEAPVVAEASGEESVVTEPAEEPTLIRIGEREFASEKEALRYAEELEQKNTQLEAYNQGIRDTLGTVAPVQPAEPEEDNFDEKFYADPKGTLAAVRKQATEDALRMFDQQTQREVLWNQFLTANPDIRRKDAERILAEPENWAVLSKLTDTKKAMAILAQKTRAEYAEIEELRKPRVELPANKRAAVPASGGAAPRVTQPKKDEAPLDFVSQLKRMKG